MMMKSKRIVSLLPGTTEIVAALGAGAQLVGRSHECDTPCAVQELPVCTRPKFDTEGRSYRIGQRIKALLQEGLSVYRVEAERLAELKPDLIITQDHCEACAVSTDEVKRAVAEYLDAEVEILSLSPTDLDEVYDSIRHIAGALHRQERGRALIRSMKQSFAAVADCCASRQRNKLLCLEWLDPLMTAGNWVPELADMAGANMVGAQAGTHSPWIEWEQLKTIDPGIIAIMPCGYTIPDTLEEMERLTARSGWAELSAVRNNRVYIADGHHYFNRPGPRLTDSARILAEITHPSLDFTFKGRGWVPHDNHHEPTIS